MGQQCTVMNGQHLLGSYGQMMPVGGAASNGSNNDALTPIEAALLSENFRAVCKNALQVGLTCEEKIVKHVPEAAQILQTASNHQSHRHALMGQGVVLLKGIGFFVEAANDQAKLLAHVERLSHKHAELYGLGPERMAEALNYIEDTFLQHAIPHCTPQNRDDTIAAWRKLFRDVKMMFMQQSYNIKMVSMNGPRAQ